MTFRNNFVQIQSFLDQKIEHLEGKAKQNKTRKQKNKKINKQPTPP